MEKISWMQFCSIENSVRGLYKIVMGRFTRNAISCESEIYSISDNTLGDYWVTHEDELFGSLYAENELLLAAKIIFLKEAMFKGYLRIKLIENGEFIFDSDFQPAKSVPSTRLINLLEEASNDNRCAEYNQHEDFYLAINSLCTILSDLPKEDIADLSPEEITRLRKYVHEEF